MRCRVDARMIADKVASSIVAVSSAAPALLRLAPRIITRAANQRQDARNHEPGSRGEADQPVDQHSKPRSLRRGDGASQHEAAVTDVEQADDNREDAARGKRSATGPESDS